MGGFQAAHRRLARRTLRSDRADPPVAFELDGHPVEATAGVSLLEALRDQLGVRSVKDGCSPQGQCGCCTVLVDGAPRVACVTPVARVGGRAVTTVDGLDDADRWADAFAQCGASQCGFCTPGIIMRLSAMIPADRVDRAKVDRALLAHLCRCTGWQTIREACVTVGEETGVTEPSAPTERDLDAAARRAALEGRVAQTVGPDVALGRGGFADDAAPSEALIAVRGPDDDWVVAETLTAARELAGKVQGRRTTAPASHPVDLPDGDWTHTLRTTWIEPAYLEPDAAWCRPGGEPVSPLGNGGAFGGKVTSDVTLVARRLADEHDRPVRVLWSREDTVRHGPKRPPVAIGLRSDGTGVVRAVRPEVIRDVPVPDGVALEWVDVAGPPVSLDLRAAVWAEVAAVHAIATDADTITTPDGAVGAAEIADDGAVRIQVACGEVLDETVLRSYCIGAAHMALGMVRSESVSLDDHGSPLDLTIRSFGVLRSVDTPPIEFAVGASDGPAVNGSDAVFAAVLAAAWRAAGAPDRWPV
ncbi:MAG: 2Fe-2S iron-sulfur cluster-binding protein [Actinomycetota bacterium]